MATYLVTGGAGFIGSNIVRTLVERGERVRVLDNLSTGRIDNIKAFLDSIDFIEGDITDMAVVQKAVNGVDFVLHHAAIPSVPRSVDDPVLTNRANIEGTLTLLVASREAGVKRFIYAASSSAYGDSPIMPKEESMPTSVNSPYALQKLTGEHYCQMFFKLYGLQTVCLRYFNVFGPHQDPDSPYSAVIPVFIKKIARGESPTIFGDVSRDFTYVDNNVLAMILACHAPDTCAGEVINIATGVEISLDQLVEKINTVLGTQIQPTRGPLRAGDVAHSLADISKAQKLLGYKVAVGFDEGLRRTIAFYTNQ